MKNLFLTLAFVLATSFTFAGTNLSNETLPSEEVALQVDCFDFILSCGITGTVCGSNTSDMVDAIMFVDDLIC